MDISEKVRICRLTKNLTQQAIANKIGISVTALGDIERGKTKDLTVNRLEQIAKVLNVSAKELLEEGNNHHPSTNTDLIELQQQMIENYKAAMV